VRCILDQITRRKFLQIAGGITFLSLTPVGKGVFAGPTTERPLPLFTAIPYIQPGSASLLTEGQDTLVIAWQTQNLPASFEVYYGLGKKFDHSAPVVVGERTVGGPATPFALGQLPGATPLDETKRLSYSASLSGLQLGKTYHYRVIGNGEVIAEGYATSRKPRGTAVRFVALGDNSCDDVKAADLGDRAVAYYAYQSHPDFIMNTGDNVYESGLDSEYSRYFFPVYNAGTADPKVGAPLLRSIPLYTVMANHDVSDKVPVAAGSTTTTAGADFNKKPDSLAYYTAMYMPSNGPSTLTSPTPIVCDDSALLAQFKDCAGSRFPSMANYSFDYGDIHFLCIDSNEYVDPTDQALQSWIAQDLTSTEATWKFVVYHHPAFNVGGEHYLEQHMRVLSPLLEVNGVDLVLHGHEHTYQRTQPLKFVPTDITRASMISSKNRTVPGVFTVDRDFDGVTKTVPNGIIYITTGAGGKELYDPGYTDAPSKWLHPEDNNVAYVAKFYSALHSLTLIEVDGNTVTLKQQNENGDIVDQVTITKA